MDLQTAQRLYEYRKANGFSQEELAEKIGVSRQAISKWERSESSPDTDNLIALARLYGITIDELINGSDTPKKTEAPKETDAPVTEKAAMPEEAAAPAEDKVDISLKNGINVDSANGDSVHIGLDGIKVNANNTQEFNDHILKNAKKNSPLFDAIVACAGFLLFFLTGFLCKGWAYSWLFLLMIPVIITAGESIRSKNPGTFCYPVLMVVLYCGLGLTAHIWHPTWILFITIPIYYILCDAYKKSKATVTEQAAQGASGTYYTPNTINEKTSSAYAQEQGENKTARIILGVLIGFLIAAVIGVFAIAAGYHMYSFGVGPVIIDNYDDYAVGSGEVAADSLRDIEIDWVNGNINVAYYDGDTVSFTEAEQSDPDRQLRYKLEDGTLEIVFCKDAIRGLDGFNINGYSKDLTVYIPQGKALDELDIDNVSAKVNIDGITAKSLSADSVSGGITAAGSFEEVRLDSVSAASAIAADGSLKAFKADSVSADITLYLPADTTGFTVTTDAVSGKINANDFTENGSSTVSDGNLIYGDGHINIDLDTVSGNLNIKSVNVSE